VNRGVFCFQKQRRKNLHHSSFIIRHSSFVIRHSSFSPMFNIVLVEPEIPPNTGTIGRLCLATDAHLHLVRPLGFSIDEKTLRRAGLDYWEQVKLTVWDSLDALFAAQPKTARNFFLTTKCERAYYDEEFHEGDFLIFGRETKGLPEALLAANRERCLTIPMTDKTRSLNLATAAAIVLFEAVRQVRVRK
jgi:tRNA (cytidine/uridine-2'-O-)-methyltransferase